MFLLISGGHVGAHVGGHQHGVSQPRPQGLLLDDFQNGGSSVEDPGTQQKSRDQFVHGGWKFIQNGGQDKE